MQAARCKLPRKVHALHILISSMLKSLLLFTFNLLCPKIYQMMPTLILQNYAPCLKCFVRCC